MVDVSHLRWDHSEDFFLEEDPSPEMIERWKYRRVMESSDEDFAVHSVVFEKLNKYSNRVNRAFKESLFDWKINLCRTEKHYTPYFGIKMELDEKDDDLVIDAEVKVTLKRRDGLPPKVVYYRNYGESGTVLPIMSCNDFVDRESGYIQDDGSLEMDVQIVNLFECRVLNTDLSYPDGSEQLRIRLDYSEYYLDDEMIRDHSETLAEVFDTRDVVDLRGQGNLYLRDIFKLIYHEDVLQLRNMQDILKTAYRFRMKYVINDCVQYLARFKLLTLKEKEDFLDEIGFPVLKKYMTDERKINGQMMLLGNFESLDGWEHKRIEYWETFLDFAPPEELLGQEMIVTSVISDKYAIPNYLYTQIFGVPRVFESIAYYTSIMKVECDDKLYLSVFVHAASEECHKTCRYVADVWIKVVGTPDVITYGYNKELSSNGIDWGVVEMLEWVEVMNPQYGYIDKDGLITIEAQITRIHEVKTEKMYISTFSKLFQTNKILCQHSLHFQNLFEHTIQPQHSSLFDIDNVFTILEIICKRQSIRPENLERMLKFAHRFSMPYLVQACLWIIATNPNMFKEEKEDYLGSIGYSRYKKYIGDPSKLKGHLLYNVEPYPLCDS